MSVKLRLRRLGRKKIPVFSIIATDSRNARDGRYIEDLGRYYPLKQPAEVQLDEERILYWLGNGAQPSDTVRSILSKRGLMLHHHLKLKGKSEAEIRDQVNEHLKRVAEKGDAIKVTPKMRDAGALEEERERAEQREKEAEELDSLREEAVPLQDVSEAEEDGDAEDEAADDASEDHESQADAETAADGDDAEASADDHDADAPAETDEAEEGDEEADASAEEETSDDTDATGDAEASDEADADDEEEKDDT